MIKIVTLFKIGLHDDNISMNIKIVELENVVFYITNEIIKVLRKK